MRKRRAEVGLGVAMIVLGAFIASGVRAPSSGLLPAWFVPIGAVIIALGLALRWHNLAGRRLAILATVMAVIVSWGTDVLPVKGAALATGGLVMLAAAWHARDHPGGTS